MCLLITQTKDTNFTEEHLRDFYTRNRDGIGVMWGDGQYLYFEKIIPKDADEAVAFYNKYARGKDCAVHYRMRTHGDIDHENTHPYPVFGFDPSLPHPGAPLLLMHNGVLHTGNAKDQTKSDTWHYVRDYLHMLLMQDQEIAFSKEFADVVGKHIGNNRFVLMDHTGRMATINKSQGVEFNGAWLSNTYAWSADKYMPRPKYTPTYYTPGSWGSTGKSVPPKGGSKKTANIKRSTPMNTSVGGRSTLDLEAKYLDDILEIRDLIDTFMQDSSVTDRQIAAAIEEMGESRVYMLIELVIDGMVTQRYAESVFTNRLEMRSFARRPQSDFYKLNGNSKQYALQLGEED